MGTLTFFVPYLSLIFSFLFFISSPPRGFEHAKIKTYTCFGDLGFKAEMLRTPKPIPLFHVLVPPVLPNIHPFFFPSPILPIHISFRVMTPSDPLLPPGSLFAIQ